MNAGGAGGARPKNLGCIFAGHLGGRRPAVVDLSRPDAPTYDYDQLDAMANAVARGLKARGLAPGDRIAILALNRVEYLAVFFGAMRAGVVPAPINIKLAADVVDYVIRDSGAKLAFAEEDFLRLLPSDLPVVRFGADFDGFLDPGPFEPVVPEIGRAHV